MGWVASCFLGTWFYKTLFVATNSPMGLFDVNLEWEVGDVWVGLIEWDYIYLWGWNYLMVDLV